MIVGVEYRRADCHGIVLLKRKNSLLLSAVAEDSYNPGVENMNLV